mmetsp:Transcript_30288/g.101226  ORF Transcript_30288/g.101226 Transcript_30288/m.101226 type:complete len:218 (-) Transcript_30288:297-950(-)
MCTAAVARRAKNGGGAVAPRRSRKKPSISVAISTSTMWLFQSVVPSCSSPLLPSQRLAALPPPRTSVPFTSAFLYLPPSNTPVTDTPSSKALIEAPQQRVERDHRLEEPGGQLRDESSPPRKKAKGIPWWPLTSVSERLNPHSAGPSPIRFERRSSRFTSLRECDLPCSMCPPIPALPSMIVSYPASPKAAAIERCPGRNWEPAGDRYQVPPGSLPR